MGLWIVVSIFVLYSYIFVYKTKTGSPYVPSDEKNIKRMVSYVKKGDVVLDLGAGDGRVLDAAVKRGAKEAWGREIEPFIFIKGYLKYRDVSNLHIVYGNMWGDDFSKYDVVFVYQLERFNERFAKKCLEEMKPGSIIVSNTYRIPGLPGEKRDGALFIYRV